MGYIWFELAAVASVLQVVKVGSNDLDKIWHMVRLWFGEGHTFHTGGAIAR